MLMAGIVVFAAIAVAGVWWVSSNIGEGLAGSYWPLALKYREGASSLQTIQAARAEWGQLGDYFGGMLNPIFGFLSLMALLITLAMQRVELQQSREALKVSQEELKLTREEQAKAAEALQVQNKAIQKQSFEQTFFAWLGTYRDVLGEIRSEEGATGRAALQALWESRLAEGSAGYWDEYMLSNRGPSPLAGALQQLGKENFRQLTQAHYPVMSKAALNTWEELYKEQMNQLGSLYRVLYRLVLWVDEHPALTPGEKWEYVAIVRAQLSWIEMVCLFYNGHTPQGAKFKALINRYALFDNLDPISDPLVMLMKENPPDSVGYSASAFSSGEARAGQAKKAAASAQPVAAC